MKSTLELTNKTISLVHGATDTQRQGEEEFPLRIVIQHGCNAKFNFTAVTTQQKTFLWFISYIMYTSVNAHTSIISQNVLLSNVRLPTQKCVGLDGIRSRTASRNLMTINNMIESTRSSSDMVPQMTNPKAAMRTSHDPSFDPTRNDASNDVPISAWAEALKD